MSNPAWLSSFHINERKGKDYRSGHVFLAGDAAHIHSPAGGQGVNTGIQDACNLAWKLALVLHGVAAAEPLLSSYSTERGAVGEEVLKNAGNLTRLGILHGSVLQAIRNHVAALVLGARAARQTVAEALTELSIGYSDSPLNGPEHHVHGGPKVGERAPVLQVEPRIGSGNAPRFVVALAQRRRLESGGSLPGGSWERTFPGQLNGPSGHLNRRNAGSFRPIGGTAKTDSRINIKLQKPS